MEMSAVYTRRTIVPLGGGIWLAIALALFLTGCAPTLTRPLVEDKELIRQRVAYAAAGEKALEQAVFRLLERLKSQVQAFEEGKRSEPPVMHVLIISGGGDFGAFGAGFLQGWGTVKDPAWQRPQFDIVSGVSTGALIAPFAFLGDDASYDRIARLYREPSEDWINRRGLLFFLPGNQSLVRIDGLKRDIRREFDDAFVQRVVECANEGRVLAIGTTNLDFGKQSKWDLGYECRSLSPPGSNDRMVDIILASSAIPGAFPPVEIDGALYADGAITANILYEDSMRADTSLTTRWAKLFPDMPMPRTCYWVIINNQLEGPPQVTQPNWLSVTGAALATAVRSSTYTSLQNLAGQLELINLSGLGRKQLRVISIPNDWRPPAEGRFERETMQSLVDLGFKLGSDPSAWTTIVDAPKTPANARP